MNTEWECNVCYQPFGEAGNSPRVLSCGHTFCLSCLQQVINTRKVCPYCQARISAANASDIPVNYTVCEIIKSSEGRPDNDKPLTNVKCIVHFKEPCTTWCYTCNIAICKLCALYTHQEPPDGLCELDSMKSTGFNLKKLVIININKLLNHIQVIEKEYDKSAFEMLDNPSEVENMHKFTEIGNTIECLIRSLLRIKHSIFDAKEANIEETIQLSDIEVNQIKKRIPKIWAPYACQKRNGKTRWAKIKALDEGYVLNCLREEIPPLGTPTMPYSEVRHLVSNENSTAFLDLLLEDEKTCRIEIKMRGETDRGTHFLALCSGEFGPSYAQSNLSLDWSWFGWHKIRGGDYENNDGTGGAAVMSNIDCNGYVGKTKWKKGVVGGRSEDVNRLAQFQINLTESSFFYIKNGFGDVVSGMEVLENVSKTKNSSMFVDNCGLIIPPFSPTLSCDSYVGEERNTLQETVQPLRRTTPMVNNAVTILSVAFIAISCFIPLLIL